SGWRRIATCDTSTPPTAEAAQSRFLFALEDGSDCSRSRHCATSRVQMEESNSYEVSTGAILYGFSNPAVVAAGQRCSVRKRFHIGYQPGGNGPSARRGEGISAG